MKQNHRAGFLMLITATALWGLTYPLMKLAIHYIDEIPFLAMRFGIGALVLLLIANKRLKQMNRKLLKHGLLLGLFLFVAMVCQTVGLRYTSATNCAFISEAYIVAIPFYMALRYHIRVSRVHQVSFVAALAGLSLVCGVIELHLSTPFVTVGLTGLNIGDGISLLGAVFFGAYLLNSNRYAHAHDPALLATVNISAVAVYAILLTPFVPSPHIDLMHPVVPVLFLVLGVFSSAVCYYFMICGHAQMEPLYAALVLSAEPMFGALFAMIIPGVNGQVERMTLTGMMGCICIMSGILLTELKDEWDRRRQKEQEEQGILANRLKSSENVIKN